MTIELNDTQARLIATALEEHSRMLCGQLELTFIKSLETSLYKDCKYDDKFWERRDLVNHKLKEIKELIFPELTNHEHYGIGKSQETDLGYEIYKEILYHFEMIEKGKQGENYKTNVHSYAPLKLTNEPIIKITN